MQGFYNRLLRIDMNTRKVSDEDIPDEVTARYLGGKGLGAWLMTHNAPVGVDPMAPENPLVIVTGPATDSGLPAASRHIIMGKSPQTGILGQAAAGGHTAIMMRATGYDAILIQGASAEPVYLEISDEKVVFHDAKAFWGMDGYEAEEALQADVDVRGAKAIVIGPAGENGVVFSCINNDRGRQAARTGMGAVMGSKKIKGIVFYGKQRCELFDRSGIEEWDRAFRKANNMGGTAKFYRDIGTPGVVDMTNEAGAFPSYYWTKGTVPYWAEICGTTMAERLQPRSKACARCFMACGKMVTITNEGPYAGTKVEGPEYETIYTYGGLNGIQDIAAIAYINELCDRLGIDTISAGNATGLAIEASMRKKVDFRLEFGDVQGIATLLREIGTMSTERGRLFAKGTRAVAKELGLEDVVVHVKGLEPAGYEPRALKGMGLAYAISERGADHLRATVYKPEMSGKVDPQAIEGKAELVLDFEDRHTIFDTLIFCRFYRDSIGWDELPVIVHGLTGLDVDKAALQKISADIANIIRAYNLREGMTPADDTLPPRILNEPLESGKRITKAELDKMIGDYYALRGW